MQIHVYILLHSQPPTYFSTSSLYAHHIMNQYHMCITIMSVLP